MDAAAHAVPTTMTAWQQHVYGGPQTVVAAEVPVPSPAEGQVLLKVAATSLNAADIHVMHGDPLLVRFAFGLRRPTHAVRGMDVAGTVIAVAPDVTSPRVGDRVVGQLPSGGLAGYAVARASALVTLPASVTEKDAATLPIAAGTAWQALDAAVVDDGARVLVLGASGGVGTFAVQLAALRGAEVSATCGERSRALIEGLGAVRTWDYRATAVTDLPQGAFDVVIDLAGTAPLRALRGLLREGGRAMLVAGEGGRVLGPMGRLLRATVLSIGSRRPLRAVLAVAKPDVVQHLLALIADGELHPVIERTWPLAEAGTALAHVDAGHTVGKVVVTV